MVLYCIAHAGNFVFAEGEGTQYLFRFQGAALSMVRFIAANVVQKTGIYAYDHEMLYRDLFHPVAVGFYVNEGGTVDAHPSTVVNAMAEFFVVAGLHHRSQAHNARRVIKKPFCNGERGLEPGVKLRDGVFRGDSLGLPLQFANDFIHALSLHPVLSTDYPPEPVRDRLGFWAGLDLRNDMFFAGIMLQQAEFFRNKPPESRSIQKFECLLLSGEKIHCLFPHCLNYSLRLISGHRRLGDQGKSEIDKTSQVPDSFVFLHDFSLGVF
jgi:hypothetical protein